MKTENGKKFFFSHFSKKADEYALRKDGRDGREGDVASLPPQRWGQAVRT